MLLNFSPKINPEPLATRLLIKQGIICNSVSPALPKTCQLANWCCGTTPILGKRNLSTGIGLLICVEIVTGTGVESEAELLRKLALCRGNCCGNCRRNWRGNCCNATGIAEESAAEIGANRQTDQQTDQQTGHLFSLFSNFV